MHDTAAAHGLRSFVRRATRSNVKRTDLTPLPLANGVWRSNLTAMYNMCGSALIDRHSVYYDR